jgi:protein TonB
MTDKYVEKSFLYFVILSLVVHAVALIVLYHMKEEKRAAKPEPYMVELEDLPPSKSVQRQENKAHRFAEKKRRVAREVAPKGLRERDRIGSLPGGVRRPAPPGIAEQGKPVPQRSLPGGVREPLPGGEGVQPKAKPLPDLAKLYPTPDRMAKLDEGFRKKYDTEVEQGETKTLNTDDIRFGSFLRRFENAVYGVWRYPAEAARSGVQGMTPVKITFNRKGEIVHIQLLRSSGSRILDDEVLRTLHAIGPLGGFPKEYTKDEFYLIATFQYNILQGTMRGTLH